MLRPKRIYQIPIVQEVTGLNLARYVLACFLYRHSLSIVNLSSCIVEVQHYWFPLENGHQEEDKTNWAPSALDGSTGPG